jgi:hypothetical protein
LINHGRLPEKIFRKDLYFQENLDLAAFMQSPISSKCFLSISPIRVTQSIEKNESLQDCDVIEEAMARKIMGLTSSRNISTDIHATDGGVTAPAVAKTGKGIFARVLDTIAESQTKRTEREGRVFLDGSSTQSQNRR